MQAVELPAQIEVPSRREMRGFGARLAAGLRPGDVIFLEGPLGAGKTFLTRAIARALGVPSREPITSPTFALVQVITSGRVPIVHADLHRLDHPDALEPLGLTEQLASSIGILEWSVRFADSIAHDGLVITLSRDGRDKGRAVTIDARGPRGRALAAGLVPRGT